MTNPQKVLDHIAAEQVVSGFDKKGSALIQGVCPACGKNTLFRGNSGYVTCSWSKCPDPEAPTKLLEDMRAYRMPNDGHMDVLLRAHAIYLERESEYAETWKEYGLKGSIVHLRTCVTRAWRQVWSGRIGKVDNLLDAINYCVFSIRNAEDGNADGEWGYGD